MEAGLLQTVIQAGSFGLVAVIVVFFVLRIEPERAARIEAFVKDLQAGFIAASKEARDDFLAAQKEDRESRIRAAREERGDYLGATKAQEEAHFRQLQAVLQASEREGKLHREACDQQVQALAKSITSIADIVIGQYGEGRRIVLPSETERR
jgi:hypothetical protein